MKAVLFPFARPDPAERLAQDFPEIELVTIGSAAEADAHLADTDILLLSNRTCTKEMGAALKKHAHGRLRWIHFTSAGLDRGIEMGLPDHLPITTSSGTKARVIAEHAMTLLLTCVRLFPVLGRAQTDHRWVREEVNRKMGSLEDATVCVVGLGAVGCDLARKLGAFDARVIGVSRGRADAPVERIFPRERLREALALSDAVVITTNADRSSFQLIGAGELAAMKPGAYIVNISRGSIIDEPALVAALAEGRIAGAGLDVVATEPMPAHNPLWDMQNVVITPHVAGGGSTGYAGLREIFRENLARLASGQPLLNLYRPDTETPTEAPAKTSA
jgi:phosphoglycerate dehydrogenase-like enzyme